MLGTELGENSYRETATAEFEPEVIEEFGSCSIGVHHMLSYAHCISHSVSCQIFSDRFLGECRTISVFRVSCGFRRRFWNLRLVPGTWCRRCGRLCGPSASPGPRQDAAKLRVRRCSTWWLPRSGRQRRGSCPS